MNSLLKDQDTSWPMENSGNPVPPWSQKVHMGTTCGSLSTRGSLFLSLSLFFFFPFHALLLPTLFGHRGRPTTDSQTTKVSAGDDVACGLHLVTKRSSSAAIFPWFWCCPTSIYSEIGAIRTNVRQPTKLCPLFQMNRHRWKVGHYSYYAFHEAIWWGETTNLWPILQELSFEIYINYVLRKFWKSRVTRPNCQIKFVSICV